MMKPMKRSDMDVLAARFGSDISTWPDDVRPQADTFLVTPEGQKWLSEEALVGAAILSERTAPFDEEGESAFLDRLLDIPGANVQLRYPEREPSRSTVSTFLKDILETFTPVGLASQGLAYAVMLAAGIFVGLQTPSDETTSVDLSDTFFSSGANYDFGSNE